MTDVFSYSSTVLAGLNRTENNGEFPERYLGIPGENRAVNTALIR